CCSPSVKVNSCWQSRQVSVRSGTRAPPFGSPGLVSTSCERRQRRTEGALVWYEKKRVPFPSRSHWRRSPAIIPHLHRDLPPFCSCDCRLLVQTCPRPFSPRPVGHTLPAADDVDR